ncbi:UNVERIFIED_CONTAM: Rdx family protein [Hammondia hammondi]|eukprot:XP_008887838.1 Rdx family protein [Hammondia hammondi]
MAANSQATTGIFFLLTKHQLPCQSFRYHDNRVYQILVLCNSTPVRAQANVFLSTLFIGHEDPGTTGNFEIRINGKLVHSKKTKKQGFLHANKEQQEVVRQKIKEALGN